MSIIKLFLIQCLSALAFFISAAATPSIKVGVTAGPHAEILEFIKKHAKEQNFEIQIIEFNDYIMPNLALASGEIDANSYQHLPFLEEQIKSRGYKLQAIAKTVLFPFGIYSEKIKNLDGLKNNATVAIPNDPTNSTRALFFLAKLGLITLDPNATSPTLHDITSNPKKLKIIELEAPQLPSFLKDVDIALINTDWIITAGMSPEETIATEGVDSPYINVIAVRAKDLNNPIIQQFVKIYQSKATKDFIKNKFKNAAIPAWD